MHGVTSRSGRVIKKSTKLMDFTSPDDIETVKAKKMASATKKLNMVKTELSQIAQFISILIHRLSSVT